ncbi:hypothetical protein SODALDRAFT_267866 [Sodiomyces alkalinus F11]|uniref:DUF833-domain-containing protein n=1 Tax=Sodiomyces alkalinus (strain CBS 110278 / VKM F-3762 / F11) TaxID=1314773 RepID=A0A3N2Q786_SODAK|nr:hypothetical protein SODALDRAFT_267866 [Sodiomyces alkalinus F11]ROT42547.1 hypothetical protein SODALDRAFT_267866 [Sodiomyces alkalinus F11]
MCIVLLTTAHPDYALIAIDNRDEFILRPTSRPHWWRHEPSGANVLSSRDLQRAEMGTWLGITDQGLFAVLTNYRETDPTDADHPVCGQRSRGGMVTAWLGADPDASVADNVHRLVRDQGVKGVGGFSMVAGKLRKKRQVRSHPHANPLEPIAIVSNRCAHVHDVPWIADVRGEVYGLSNTTYDNPDPWPKVADGKRLLREAIDDAIANHLDEDQLTARLYAILDRDTLPPPATPEMGFADYVTELQKSIFVPAIGDASHRAEMEAAVAKGKGEVKDMRAAEELTRPDGLSTTTTTTTTSQDGQAGPNVNTGVGFETGLYGTQRQTIIMVDWDGNVSYRERALWDSNGNPIEKGQGDVLFRFKIQGWDGEDGQEEGRELML